MNWLCSFTIVLRGQRSGDISMVHRLKFSQSSVVEEAFFSEE